MKYQEADRLKKRSLLSLIAENKFEDGKSLGSSISSAVSDKLKAKVTRIKKRFDPLNIIAGLTGSGVIGRSIRTASGRAMGRTDDDIDYFGGYKRKKKKTAEALVVKTSPKSLTPIKTEDTIADSVSKLYTLMRESFDQKKEKDELKRDFAKQRQMESDRRHKELIKVIAGISIGKKSTEKKTDDGFNVLSFIKGLWDKIKTFVQPLIDGLDWVKGKIGWLWDKALEFVSWISKLSIWEDMLAGLSRFKVNFARAIVNCFDLLPDFILGALPMAALYEAAELSKSAPNGGNTKGQTKALDNVHEATGFKKQSSNLVPEQDKKDYSWYDGILDPEVALKEKRKKRIQSMIDEHSTTFTPSEAEDVKKAYNIKVPKEMIQEKPSASPVLKPTGAGGGRGTMGPTSAPAASPSAESVPAKASSTPVSAPSDTGSKLESAAKTSSEQTGNTESSDVNPVVLGGTTTTVNPGQSTSTSIGSPSVRNDDETLSNSISGMQRGHR